LESGNTAEIVLNSGTGWRRMVRPHIPTALPPMNYISLPFEQESWRTSEPVWALWETVETRCPCCSACSL